MKRVFKIKVEEKNKPLFSKEYDYHIFAKDMTEAIKKVSECISNDEEITEAEFYCSVDEDMDLEDYKEE
jgi:hypothetical protein